MTAKTILQELKSLGRDSYKRILLNHGVQEPCFGVKIGDLKKIHKRVKTDYALALALYETGVYDAMYLAGLIADDGRMTKKDLRHWMAKAYGGPLSGSIVPWVAAGGPHGFDLALEWIESRKANVAEAGWATLASWAAVKPDMELHLDQLESLLNRVEKTIHQAPNAARYQMNEFVIAIGAYVEPLSDAALRAAKRIGPVTVDKGETACQVPSAPEHIRKVREAGQVGRKRKTAKC